MLGAAGRRLEVDCLWRQQRLAVELDSRSLPWHGCGFEQDRERDRALHAAGWDVIRVTWRQLNERAAGAYCRPRPSPGRCAGVTVGDVKQLLCILLGAFAAFAAPAAAQAAPGPCPGRAIEPDRVITGEFGTELAKSYVMVPFEVPARNHRGPGQVLLRPARGRHEQAYTWTSGSTSPAGAVAAVGGRRVPRLGRLEPPGRDGLGRGLLERGSVHLPPARRAAREDDARLPAGPASGRAPGRSSWAWRR